MKEFLYKIAGKEYIEISDNDMGKAELQEAEKRYK